MQHGICKDLSTEPFREANNGYFDTDPNNTVLNLSDERCKHPIKEYNLDYKKAFYSLFPVKNLQRCNLAFQNTIGDRAPLLIYRVKQKEGPVLVFS